MEQEIMWAISGRFGLYYGTYRTRVEAIGVHLGQMTRVVGPVEHGHLTPDARREWAALRRKGDRAVRVAVRILEN